MSSLSRPGHPVYMQDKPPSCSALPSDRRRARDEETSGRATWLPRERAGKVAVRRSILLVGGVLGALLLCALLAARLLPCTDQISQVTGEPLAARVRSARALVADAEYQLALRPRLFTIGPWQIAVQPARPDPQRAFDDAVRIENLAFDQPEVLTDVSRVRLAYQRLEYIARLYRQAQMTYLPDYAQVQTWLDDIDTLLNALLPDSRHGPDTPTPEFPQVGWN